MAICMGVLASDQVAIGLVEGNKLAGPLQLFDPSHRGDALQALPAEAMVRAICDQIESARLGEILYAVGVGFPGIIHAGVVTESPNLPQVKGYDLGRGLSTLLAQAGIPVPVVVFNDADVMAAGIAATRGQLHRMVRVWTLGNGIGFGRYPWTRGVWEGGHCVVTLDPKERFCGCGGVGHLEGIMGHRAMRMRFLDLEPEEVFTEAAAGDERCSSFVKLWHRALAAGTANSVHIDGPGDFFITGPNARFIDLTRLHEDLQEMVKMTPLQGSRFEVVATSHEVGVIGAAVNAERFSADRAARGRG